MKIRTRYRINIERTKWGYYMTWYAHWISEHIIEGELIDTIEPYTKENASF